MTPYSVVYDAFLSKILEDEWGNWTQEEVDADLRQILESSLPYFKFPKHSLDRDEFGFHEDLNSQEIQIIAHYMRCEWLNRNINTWENIKPMYDERDFSPANFIEKLRQLLAQEQKDALRLEGYYYRSINYKPFDYTKLAGKN